MIFLNVDQTSLDLGSVPTVQLSDSALILIKSEPSGGVELLSNLLRSPSRFNRNPLGLRSPPFLLAADETPTAFRWESSGYG
eukprot:7127855-Pyramimonas_sp.AAC.1